MFVIRTVSRTCQQARFKYPPHWVPLPDLYKAMALIDAMTGLPRGAMLLSRKESIEPVLFTLDTRVSGSVWKEAHHYFAAELPGVAAKQIASAMGRGRGSCSVAFSLPNLLASIAASLPTTIADVMITRVPTSCAVSHGGMHNACSRHEAAEQLLLELRALPLYKVNCFLSRSTRHGAVVNTCCPSFDSSFLHILMSLSEQPFVAVHSNKRSLHKCCWHGFNVNQSFCAPAYDAGHCGARWKDE